MKNSLQFITELALRSMKILAYSRLYMCESVCVCVCTNMYVWMYVSIHTNMYVWMEARGLSTSGIVVLQRPEVYLPLVLLFLRCPPSFFETGYLPGLGFSKQAKLTGLRALGICLFPLPVPRLQTCAMPGIFV